jgi:hypothetical protein
MIIVIIVYNYLLLSSHMQSIYNYILETNPVSRVYNVAATPYLQFVLHVMLFPMLDALYIYSNTFPSMCILTSSAVFSSCLISCLPVRYSGTLCMISRWFQLPYYYWSQLYFHLPHKLFFCFNISTFKKCSAPFLTKFLSPEIIRSIKEHYSMFLFHYH